MMAMPIFGDHLKLILDSMLEFYNDNQTFMINFWSSLGRLA